ncbi:MAG: rhomboid family intramembrane serine protease [Pseudomonadales bacterium]
MFPIRDENPTQYKPVATIVLIGLNVAAWVLLQGLGTEPALTRSVCTFGLVPADVLDVAVTGQRLCPPGYSDGWLGVLTSMFMHGGWMHIIGNMWFLWVFGDNVEDAMGRARFVIFYVLCGIGAALAQMVSSPGSAIPMVGASGAIGGVMGAYAVLYPRAHVILLVFLGFFVTTVAVPAIFMLGYWFLLQLLSGAMAPSHVGGVAFWAHVGGFVAGMVLVFPFRRPERVDWRRRQGPSHNARHRWF